MPPTDTRYALKWDGEWHITYEIFRDLGLAFGVVLILIYILIVGWFQSFLMPLVIMVAIFSTLMPTTFPRVTTLQAMMFQLPELGLLSLAMAIPLISGGINLAIIATANSAGLLMAWILTAVMPPEVWPRRAFDHQWIDRPGGVPATLALLAVRAVADAHGGTAIVGSGRGTRVSLIVPTGI